MRSRLSPLFGAVLLAAGANAADAPPVTPAAPPPQAWRTVDPNNLVLIDTKYGETAIELAPDLLGAEFAGLGVAAAVLAGLPPRATASFRTAAIISDILDATEPSVVSRIRAGADAIEACGIRLEMREGMTAIEALDTHVFTIMQAEAARTHLNLIEDGSLDPVLKKRLAKGLKIEDQVLAASLATRQQLASTFLEQVFREADILIVPVMPVRTPEAAICDPSSPSFDAKVLYQLSRWTRFVNLLGFPAVAVPVGFDDHGMPVAMQIVGKPNSDLGLIALAAAMQGSTDWHARVPSAVSDLAAAMCADEMS